MKVMVLYDNDNNKEVFDDGDFLSGECYGVMCAVQSRLFLNCVPKLMKTFMTTESSSFHYGES